MDATEDAAAAAAACDIARLPEDLLSLSLSRTAPLDACRAAAVSPVFRDAAGADAVWSGFLRDLPPLADGELSDAPPSGKALYMRLADPDRPVLLADGLMSMWLDRVTGARCYMLSARALWIVWSDTPQYWCWIPLTDSTSRFSEAAELLNVCWLEIRGSMPTKMLSQNTTYTAYMVFKIAEESYGLDDPTQEAAVGIGGSRIARQVCLHGYGSDNEAEGEEVPQNYRSLRVPAMFTRSRRNRRRVPRGVNVHQPRTRADGWMEMELGQFHNEGGDDGAVDISLMETRGGRWKKGLIVQGVEIRVQK